MNCQGCKFMTSRHEMVAPDVSATVDACKLRLTPAVRCEHFAISFLRQAIRAFKGWIE